MSKNWPIFWTIAVISLIIAFALIRLLAWPIEYTLIDKKTLADGNRVCGYIAKNLEKAQPASYIAVFGKGKRLLYRFSPVAPASVNYPRQLLLEKLEVAGSRIVTTWGMTGADYFGTHPIVIHNLRAVDFYTGHLADDPRIRKYSWTSHDFEVTNYFNPSEKAKTILTQGVSLNKKNVELTFYADDEPHAAIHRHLRITVPLEE